ncbi:MAG: hypothetical protein IJ640_04490, partial [Prevotella sp.]|nr:hypothetical protein [Prevotella sp.]
MKTFVNYNNGIDIVNNSYHSTFSAYLLRKCRQSAWCILLLLLLAMPQRVWAEHPQVKYNGAQSSVTTVAKWEEMGNPYVTVSHSGSPSINSGTYRIAGTDNRSSQTVTFTAPNGTYIGTCLYTAYQSENGSLAQTKESYFGENKDVNVSRLGFIVYSFSNESYSIKNANSVSRGPINVNSKSFYISCANNNGYGAIDNVTLNLLIPEVLTSSTGQTAPSDKSWEDKTWAKNTSKNITIVYDVADAIAKEDFNVSVTPKASNKGTMSASVTNYSNGKLTITITYKTKNADDYAENFGGTITVLSKNNINNATYTTTINGKAGAILTDNYLRFDISATQYVNTNYTPAVHTYANSTAPITYSSTNESVAYFDETKTLRIVGVGTATLAATQPANSDYMAGSATLAITVSKRTAHFVFNPYGTNAETPGNLYAGRDYSVFISIDNDVNNTLPITNISLSSSSDEQLEIDADGSAHPHIIDSNPTIHVSYPGDDEWEPIDRDFNINIVKDPLVYPTCMSEAYVELQNTDFCMVTSTG